MALTLEQRAFLNKIKKSRPDLIQQLKAEFYEERRASKTDIVEATRHRAKVLAGTKSVIKQTETKEDSVEKAVAKRTKKMAGIT